MPGDLLMVESQRTVAKHPLSVEEWGGASNLEYQHSWSDQGEGWTNSGTVQVSVMKIAELGNAQRRNQRRSLPVGSKASCEVFVIAT